MSNILTVEDFRPDGLVFQTNTRRERAQIPPSGSGVEEAKEWVLYKHLFCS